MKLKIDAEIATKRGNFWKTFYFLLFEYWLSWCFVASPHPEKREIVCYSVHIENKTFKRQKIERKVFRKWQLCTWIIEITTCDCFCFKFPLLKTRKKGEKNCGINYKKVLLLMVKKQKRQQKMERNWRTLFYVKTAAK